MRGKIFSLYVEGVGIDRTSITDICVSRKVHVQRIHANLDTSFVNAKACDGSCEGVVTAELILDDEAMGAVNVFAEKGKLTKKIRVDFSWFKSVNSGWTRKDLRIAADRIDEQFAPVGDCWIFQFNHDTCTVIFEVPWNFDKKWIIAAFPVKVEDILL